MKVIFTRIQMNSNLDVFSIEEKNILNSVIDNYKNKLCNLKVKDIIDTANVGELINYQKAVAILI